MRMKELMKRFAVFGMAAALLAPGPAIVASAAPKANTGKESAAETAELIEADQSKGAGGITPTVFKDSYRNSQRGQYRSREALPESFDLRTAGNSTTVKNQSPWGSCWAFGALSSLESSQLHGASGNEAAAEPDYSERQLAWFAYEPQTEDSIKVSAADSNQAGEGITYTREGRLDRGGNMPQAAAVLSTWQGAASEAEIPYENQEGTADPSGTWDVGAEQRNSSAIHLENADFLASPAYFDKLEMNGLPSADAVYTYDASAAETMKKALMDYGALSIAYFADQSMPDSSKNGDYFNYENYCQYVDILDSTTVQNHGVSIVGWDDNYASSNFKEGKQPEGNGAWLVKNSWGSDWGLDGYFWLSYYDRTITQVTSFQGQGTDNYDNIYQYDYLGLASAMQFESYDDESGIANVFTAKGDEEIQAVSAVTLVPDSNVSIKIYKIPSDADEPVPGDAVLMTEQSETIPHSGYHTIKLNTPAAIAAGEKFSVVQVIKGGDNQWYTPVEIGGDAYAQKAVCNQGESYQILSSGLLDMSECSEENVTFGNAMIKAFTNDAKPESDAPVLQSFDYEAYDNSDTNIKTETVTVGGSGLTLNLPAGTSYIKVLNPVLSDSADVDAQLRVKVNGIDYALGDSIARAELIREDDETAMVMTTRSAPKGTNTKDYEFGFTCDALVLTADSGNVVVTDTKGYLPASAVLTSDKINSGTVFDAVKAALEPYGGADTFYIYNLTLTPALQTGETVNLGITTESSYPRTDKTVLYHFDENSGTLSEAANDGGGTGILQADISQMGCYVITQVKEKPPVPELEAVTYSPVKTLADVVFPAADGGNWNWDDDTVIPEVRTGTYKATFTPDSQSQYYTYSADIPLTVNKAAPVQGGTGYGSGIIYGSTLADSEIHESFYIDGTAVDGSLEWAEPNACPKVKDGNVTEYAVKFIPRDTDNCNTACGSVKVQSVRKKSVTVSVKNADKIYGDDNPAFSIEIPDGTLAWDDTAEDLAVIINCTADNTTAAGSTVDITGTSSSENYDVSVTKGTLTVEKRTVNIKAKDVIINYGENLPDSYEADVTNLAPGTEQSALGLTADIAPKDVPDGNLAGTYALVLKSASITNMNYKIGSLLDGTLTIKEGTVGKVENNSGIPDSIAGRFWASGSLTGNEVLKITDITDDAVQNAFRDLLKDGQVLGAVFDVFLKEADGTADAAVSGALTVRIPVDTRYNGEQITVLHYVKAGELNAQNTAAASDTIDVYSNLTVTEGCVQIKVYSLSPFAVILPKDAGISAGTDTPSADNENKTKVTNQEVKGARTGDTAPVAMLIIAAVAAAVVIIVLIIIMVRRRRK